MLCAAGELHAASVAAAELCCSSSGMAQPGGGVEQCCMERPVAAQPLHTHALPCLLLPAAAGYPPGPPLPTGPPALCADNPNRPIYEKGLVAEVSKFL